MSNFKLKIIAGAVMCAFLINSAQSATSLLWFGNSFSEAGRQYSMVQLMINCAANCGIPASGMTVQVTPIMVPSCFADCHESNGAFSKIDNAHSDLVFIQDNTAGWCWMFWDQQRDPMANQLTNWANHAKTAGGKLVIEQMWVPVDYNHPDFTQDRSDWWYDSIAKATNSIMVPSGRAWWVATRERKDYEWIAPDWADAKHPGKVGAYLNICCQYAALTNKSPVGSTFRKVMEGDTAFVTDEEALFCQQKAWEAYQYFHGQTTIDQQMQSTPNSRVIHSKIILAGVNLEARQERQANENDVFGFKGQRILKNNLSRQVLIVKAK